MEDLNQISLVCNKVQKKLVSFELNMKHPILSAKIVRSKYGKTVLLELGDCIVFLPRRYVNIVSEKHIEDFQSKQYAVVVKEIQQMNDKQTPVLEFTHI